MSEAMTEFRITSDLSAIREAVISANFDEIRQWLDVNLEPYRNMAVTADSIPEAKTYRASIRKVRDRIDQCRKEAKSAALAPYMAFEQKTKTLTQLCDEAANAIDVQVKAFERAEADRKIERIRAVYDAGSEEAKAFLPFADVFDLRWENKGYSEDKAAEEIREALAGTEQALASIRSIGGDDTPYLLKVYRETHSLSSVMQTQSELKEARDREARRRAEAEAERSRQEQAAKTEEQESASAETEEPEEPETVYKIDFRVWANRQQLMALKAFLKEAGIRYGRCD